MCIHVCDGGADICVSGRSRLRVRVCVCAWQELGLRVSVGRHVLMRLGQACVCCGKGRGLRQQNSHSLPSPPAEGVGREGGPGSHSQRFQNV